MHLGRDHMRVELTLAALSMAIQRQRPGKGLIHHFDPRFRGDGSQYADKDYRKFKNKEEAKQALFRYIETYYNNRRFHSAIGYITPAQMELKVA
jgi:putative transposase